MSILPELEAALNQDLSLQEAKEILHKYQSLPREDYYNDTKYIVDYEILASYQGKNQERRNTSKTDWDSWDDVGALKPLGLPRIPHGPPTWPLDSESRFYLCKTFQRQFLLWFCDPERKTNLFWVDDPNLDRVPVQRGTSQRPFGVALSLATLLWESRRLACPDTVILSGNPVSEIATELAARYPPYRRLLTSVFMEDPFAFERGMRHQFRTLILQPWREISYSHPLYSLTPPLIILNGRDEDETDHSLDFIKVIREHATEMTNCPLLWIVCTRSAKLRQRAFLDFPMQWEYALLSLRDVQPWHQAELWLRSSLDHVRAQCLWLPDMLEGESWPPEEQISRLVDITAGVFDFVDAVLRFIACGIERSPVEKLSRLLDLMVDSPQPTDAEPFLALHYLFSRFLSSIVPRCRQHAMLVLEVLFASDYSLPFSQIKTTARHLAYYSGVSLQDFHSVLRDIEWTLQSARTSSGCIFEMNIPFRHFLENTDDRFSGSVFTGDCRYYTQIAKSSLNILGHSTAADCFRAMRLEFSYPSPLDEAREFHAMFKYATGLYVVVFALEGIHTDTRDNSLLSYLRCFDFRCLVYAGCRFKVFGFARLVIALYANRDHLPDLVRTEAVMPSDNQLLDKCKGVALPMVLSRAGFCINVLERPRYVLLGYGKKTVLAVFSVNRETQPPGSDTGVGIYSLDMLDDL